MTDATVSVYCTDTCSYCGAARMLLTRKGVRYEEHLVSENPRLRAEMEARSGRSTVPQIFIGETHVGGFDDLCELDKSGDLDKLLSAANC